MEELLQDAQALATKLSESACCRTYAETKVEVERDDALRKKLAAYKVRHLAFCTKIAEGASAPEEERVVSELYCALMLDERARRFLESEREATALATALFRTVAEGCPVEPAYPQI